MRMELLATTELPEAPVAIQASEGTERGQRKRAFKQVVAVGHSDIFSPTTGTFHVNTNLLSTIASRRNPSAIVLLAPALRTWLFMPPYSICDVTLRSLRLPAA